MDAPLIQLRPTGVEDLAFVLAAERHPDNAPYIHAWSQERHLAAIHSADEAHCILTAAGQAVGYTIVQGLTSPHDCLELRRIVVTQKSQGYGEAALEQIQQFAFITRQAHRLWLDVKTDNHRAKALYEKVGFKVEGCLRDCWKTEQGYESLYVMAMLQDEYLRKQGAYVPTQG